MAIRIPTPQQAGLGQQQRASGTAGYLQASAPRLDFNARQMSSLADSVSRLGAQIQERQEAAEHLRACRQP